MDSTQTIPAGCRIPHCKTDNCIPTFSLLLHTYMCRSISDGWVEKLWHKPPPFFKDQQNLKAPPSKDQMLPYVNNKSKNSHPSWVYLRCFFCCCCLVGWFGLFLWESGYGRFHIGPVLKTPSTLSPPMYGTDAQEGTATFPPPTKTVVHMYSCPLAACRNSRTCKLF